MRVSDYFNLGRTQSSLEFVDIDVRGDTRAYVDPSALRGIDSDWARECVSLLQSFFGTVLNHIQQGEHERARWLLSCLKEPNESHLGQSRGRAQGHGMGRTLARDVWRSLSTSAAVESGLLEDLEDSILFVPGIGFDIISDITTNILRRQLVTFTQHAAEYYEIPLTPDVNSGRFWDRRTQGWAQEPVDLITTTYGRLLLIPKSLVRHKTSFDPGEYYNDFILPFLQNEEIRLRSPLVEVLKNGHERVTKKSVKEKYGQGKAINLDVTMKNQDLLQQYRSSKRKPLSAPDHKKVAALIGTPLPHWHGMLETVRAIRPGAAHATEYHHAVEILLTTLLYPALDFPVREFNVNNGRKRIDIMYTNQASRGFFSWLHQIQKVPCGFVPVECKNYGAEIGNPELDQIVGRFADQRGRFGLLCHRGYGDKARVIQRCRDASKDGNGYVVALDDDDLARLISDRQNDENGDTFRYLYDRFGELV